MHTLSLYVCLYVVNNVVREVRNSANGGQREVRLWHNCATNQYN